MTDRERYVAAYTERFGRRPRRIPEFTPRNPTNTHTEGGAR